MRILGKFQDFDYVHYRQCEKLQNYHDKMFHILEEKGIPFTFHDPLCSPEPMPQQVAVYFVSCAHDVFKNYVFPEGSVLLDPHRKYSACLPNGTYIPIGVSK